MFLNIVGLFLLLLRDLAADEISLTGKEIIYSHDQSKCLIKGDAVAILTKQGEEAKKLTADYFEVVMFGESREKSNAQKIKHVIASGNVVFRQGDCTIKADNANYTKDEIVCVSNKKNGVMVEQKKNIITGDKVVADLKNGTYKAVGNKVFCRIIVS